MPHQDKIVSGIGGFAALFRADFSGMKEPCLVSCTDGVGTKVKLAADQGRYHSVAQDMVAMCVNDLICCGADPLFFLDYYATGKLDLRAAKEFLAGVRQACVESHCALIGGETAEMPGVYAGKDFDCAGFSVGVVDRVEAWGAHRVNSGDKLIALPSSGFHSNGYSLLRKVFESDMAKWVDTLLVPTRLYVDVVKSLKSIGGIHAAAHITGGGMENIPRVLSKGQIAVLKPWAMPEPFKEVQRRCGMSWKQMLETLNCGIGLVLAVDGAKSDALIARAKEKGHDAFLLGEILQGDQNAEASWQIDNYSGEGPWPV